MIVEYRYTSDHDRSTERLKKYLLESKSILDIGASINSHYENDYLINKVRSATVDLFDLPGSKLHFKGNISLASVWTNILSYVEKNGKFDCCYISHTLEDISNPKLVCNMIGLVAKKGFIAIPSKHSECKRHGYPYRGYIHHRWIFNIENGIFKAYPKQNFLEYENHLDKIVDNYNKNNAELQIFWEDSINLQLVNDDFLGPNTDSVIEYYKNLHLD